MNTTISISKDTRGLLQEFGRKSENYDDIIKRIIFEVRLQEKVQEFMDESEYSSLEEAEEWTKLKIKSMKND